MKRRIVSVLMALVMALSLLPVQALAEDAAVEEPVTEIEQAEQTGKGEEPATRRGRPGRAKSPATRRSRPGRAKSPATRRRSRSRGSRRNLCGNLYRERRS